MIYCSSGSFCMVMMASPDASILIHFIQVEALICVHTTCMCIDEHAYCVSSTRSVLRQNIFDAFLVICLDAILTMTAVIIAVAVAVGLNAYFVIFFLHSHTAVLQHACGSVHVMSTFS